MAGALGIFLVASAISLGTSGLPKDFTDYSTIVGGVLLGIVFLVYSLTGKSLVNR